MSLTSSAWRIVVVLAAAMGLAPPVFGFQAGLIGHWDGTMIREGAELEVSFDFTASGTQLKGTFTSLTQQAMDYPLASVTADSEMVHLVLGDSLVFDGELRQNEITGTFTDDDAKGNFTLRRSARTTLPTIPWMSHFTMAQSPLRVRCVSLWTSRDTQPLSSCKAAAAKHAGALIVLLLIVSHVWALPRSSTINGDRVVPQGIGSPLHTDDLADDALAGMISLLLGPISTPSELGCTDTVKVELLRRSLQLVPLRRSHLSLLRIPWRGLCETRTSIAQAVRFEPQGLQSQKLKTPWRFIRSCLMLLVAEDRIVNSKRQVGRCGPKNGTNGLRYRLKITTCGVGIPKSEISIASFSGSRCMFQSCWCTVNSSSLCPLMKAWQRSKLRLTQQRLLTPGS